MVFQYSHRGGIFLVDRRNVNSSKDVSVHAVDPGQVIKLSCIVKQLMGLVGDKITVDHWSKFKEIHDHTCMADRETEIMDSQTLAELSEGHKGSITSA